MRRARSSRTRTCDRTELALDFTTALPDWEQYILQGRTPIPALPLDDSRAGRALRLFKALKVPDIEGNPTYGEVCGDWVFALVSAIFGAFSAETNARFIREYFVLIPKKNGKTSIAAAIIVVALLFTSPTLFSCSLSPLLVGEGLSEGIGRPSRPAGQEVPMPSAILLAGAGPSHRADRCA